MIFGKMLKKKFIKGNNTNYKHSLIMLLWWTLSVYICTHSILIQFYLLTQFHSHNKYFKFDAILTILRFTKIRNVQNNINTGVNKLYNTQVTTIFFENFTFSMSNKIQMIKVKNNLKLQHWMPFPPYQKPKEM